MVKLVFISGNLFSYLPNAQIWHWPEWLPSACKPKSPTLEKICAIAEDTTSHSFIVGLLWSPCASPSVWSIWLDHSLCVQSFNCSTTLSLSFSEVFREVCEARHLVVTSPMFMRTTSIVFVVLCQAGLLRNSMERNCFLVGCDGTEPLAQIFCESFSCLQLLWK